RSSRMLEGPSTARAVNSSPSRRRLLFACAAVLAAGLVYLNAIHNPFVYDDYHTVVANASIQPGASLRAIVLHDLTRPITNISFAIDRVLWGPRPLGFHVTSVLLHMLNVALLFHLARRLAEDGPTRPDPGPASSARSGLVAAAAA